MTNDDYYAIYTYFENVNAIRHPRLGFWSKCLVWANVGILALLESNTELPIALKTGAASITAGVWRIFIMPIDTVKTTLQVIGTFQALKQIALDIRFRQ